MQYSQNDYIFLGKQVAEGRYVRQTTLILALVLVFLVGVAGGRYLFPAGDAGSFTQKRPLEQGAPMQEKADLEKQMAASILQHEEEVRQTPDNAQAWKHLGNLYFDVGKPEQAIRAYEKALELDPKDTSVMVDCGVMYRDIKNPQKALEYFAKALELDSRHEFAMFNTGIVLYHDLDRKAEALDAWRKLVKVHPQSAPGGVKVVDLIKELESR